jgi:N-acyl-D-amino-acid deacylase
LIPTLAVLATALFFTVIVIRNRGGFVCDLVIRNAEIYDGSGGKPFVGAIAVDGDRIVGVWRGQALFFPLGRRTIDAAGAALSPGFIDTHTHADLSIGDGVSPIVAANFLWQGVTTLIVGNCGRSPHETRRLAGILARRKSDVNIATLIGLNSVRTTVMGTSTAAASAQQIVQMQNLVRAGMADGAVGVSTGYAYVPGRFASAKETIALLSVARAADGVHTSHIRDEGKDILAALNEVMTASASARVPLLISHLKITGSENCGRYDSMLKRFRDYTKRSGALYFDQYPYDASSSSLELYLPDSFLRLSERDRYRVLTKTPMVLKEALRSSLGAEQVRDLSFASVASYAPHHEWRGLTIRQIDERFFGSQPSTLVTQTDVVIDMLKHGGAQMIYHNLCPDVVARIHRDLVGMVGSDSAIRFNDGASSPHPRGWGTFPRFFKSLVRERGVLTPEEAIRRMTDLPARFFGLENRGRISPGYFADLVLFDLATIEDRARYDRPFLPPSGIRVVVVNGVVEITEATKGWRRPFTESVVTGDRGGTFLRRSQNLTRDAGDRLFATTSF